MMPMLSVAAGHLHLLRNQGTRWPRRLVFEVGAPDPPHPFSSCMALGKLPSRAINDLCLPVPRLRARTQ